VKAFAANGYQIGRARVEVRIVYTGFLVLVTIGMVTMAAFQLKHIGPGPEQIAIHYRGGERAGAMSFPKSFRELVEVTHFHAFIMGIVYLVLAHLYLATGTSQWAKRAGIVVAFVGLTGDLIGVWLIRYVSAAFAYPQVAFWLAEWIGFAAFVYCPMRDMWLRHELEDDLPPD
jgi:hypothetical protein